MKRGNQYLLTAMITCIMVVSCVGKGEDPQQQVSASSESEIAFDPNIEIISTEIDGGNANISVCYEIPSDLDWVLGRLPGDVSISDGFQDVSMSYFQLINLQPASDVRPAQRCDKLVFPLTPDFQPDSCTFTVQRLAASLPQNPDWIEIQRRLEELGAGIVIEPMQGAEGLSFALIEKPDGMEALEAHNIVVGIADPVVIGPWVLPVEFQR